MERQNSRYDSHLERARKTCRFIFEHIPVAPFSSHGNNFVNVHERVNDIVDGNYLPRKIPFEELDYGTVERPTVIE